MIDWLGISHLFGLSQTEQVLAFFTPLIAYVAYILVQVILPGRSFTGYVINPTTGQPRQYRLNGLIVFCVFLVIWWFELTGMPRDWFYQSTIYAVIGGTVFTAIFSIITYSYHRKEHPNKRIKAFWTGSIQELSLFQNRFDLKMNFYAFGGIMLVLNALSGAWVHYESFGGESNPGIFLFTAFFTFYILDYFICEPVTLYTFDMIHEGIGFKLYWGSLVVYGWMFTMPLWGLVVYPDPGFNAVWTNTLMIGTSILFLVGWGISRGSNLQKYTFKRWPDRAFLGITPKYISSGDRKILYSGFWGIARHFSYSGEAMIGIAFALSLGYFLNPWAWTYGIFIMGMCVFRQRTDDTFCEEKYGSEKWGEYRARVKYRIIPGVY